MQKFKLNRTGRFYKGALGKQKAEYQDPISKGKKEKIELDLTYILVHVCVCINKTYYIYIVNYK